MILEVLEILEGELEIGKEYTLTIEAVLDDEQRWVALDELLAMPPMEGGTWPEGYVFRRRDLYSDDQV